MIVFNPMTKKKANRTVPLARTVPLLFFFFTINVNYGECVRHLNVRIGEHIVISPLAKKQVKPKNSSVDDHFLFCSIQHPMTILVF